MPTPLANVGPKRPVRLIRRGRWGFSGGQGEYRACQAIAKRLVAQDPTNAGWRRDLSVSHIKVGDVLLAQGDAAGATAEYRACLALFEHLAGRDPTDTDRQHGLSVQALLHRKEINHDEQEDEFVWSKATGKGSKMLGGSVTLGRIAFIGDELLLTANSAKRFTTGRKWLVKLPGVVFGNVVTRPVNEPAKDRPLDERISKPEPVEMTPELTAAVQEMMNKQYMGWLDTPLPVLRGKTPRQACQTSDGRRQVTMLIRTTPDPMGPAPVRVPRQAMLRELGLAQESSPEPASGSPSPAPPEPGPAASLRGKVGRNDPCPCGSGKKYKKCCGR